MNLTPTQRVTKLAKNLATNPDLVIPYLRTSVFSRKSPIDLGLPWWSFRAIERGDELFRDKRIFEYGTGGSTLRYAGIADYILCVEDHREWLECVAERLATLHLTNVELLYKPFDFRHPVDFEHSAYVSAVDSGSWDVIIIDGQDWTFNERLSCFRHVEPRVGPGSVVVVDDFWRYEKLLDENHAKQVEVYESVGPARLGVTSTAFFLY